MSNTQPTNDVKDPNAPDDIKDAATDTTATTTTDPVIIPPATEPPAAPVTPPPTPTATAASSPNAKGSNVKPVTKEASSISGKKLFPANAVVSGKIGEAFDTLTKRASVRPSVISSAHNEIYKAYTFALTQKSYEGAAAKELVLNTLSFINQNPDLFNPKSYFGGVKDIPNFPDINASVYGAIFTLFIDIASPDTRAEQLSKVNWNQLRYTFSNLSYGEKIVESLMQVFNVI